MGLVVSGLAEAVLGAAGNAGLSADTVARYRKCLQEVVEFCGQRGAGGLSGAIVEEFAAVQDQRYRVGEIRRGKRNLLVKCARMMVRLADTGEVVWGMERPDCGLSAGFKDVSERFAQAMALELAPGSVRMLSSQVRLFLAYLERAGRSDLARVTVDDVRAFMVETSQRHPAGMGNVVWSAKRFFGYLNSAGVSGVRVDGLLARVAPRRQRALACFTPEETDRLTRGIETATACGKRDLAMVLLAVSTGLRCCDITALRLDQIDWRRDEIRLAQTKTAQPLALPLTAAAGNSVADWILNGRPATAAPEVFIRLRAPFTKLGVSTGSTLMRRRLAKAGIDHAPGDGKSFHGLRRTAGTRLVESGSGLPLAAQILGHSRIDSTRRYIALATARLSECCLPLGGFACAKEGLR